MPALVVGLNPLVLVHVVGGAHNDALTVLLVDGAASRALLRRSRGAALAGGLDGGVAARVKVIGGLVGPFMLIGARRRWRSLARRRGGALRRIAGALIAFGGNALEAFVLLGHNQDRTSRWSLPQRAADGHRRR